jgi:hypothetical protein
LEHNTYSQNQDSPVQEPYRATEFKQKFYDFRERLLKEQQKSNKKLSGVDRKAHRLV